MSVTNDEVWFTGSPIELRVSKHVYACWLQHRQMKPNDTEQFGVLIGSRNEDESSIWINKCTTPQRGDISHRTRFTMKDLFHQKTITKEFKESNGELGYIGTWHTHPQDVPTPSIIDLNDWDQCALRNPDRQLVFVIIGNKQVNIYIKNKEQIEMVMKEIDT
ncbi:Mov34/MPN/PAD-1 family protein [Photobacterium phosphoreum]|nr:Mov34/MPN/PAD-1 family protein [Photobacterium phosphoreum]